MWPTQLPKAAPTVPSGLSATAISSSQINLSWTDNANNEDSFSIERSADGTTWSSLATVAANVISYSNTALSASTTYYYRIRAVNTWGNSAYSNLASATTQAASLPVVLYGSCNSSGWSAAFGAGNYTLSDLVARGVVNDGLSSLKVAAGYTVTLYKNDNFTGSSLTLTADDNCLTNESFNDRMSLMKVVYNGSALRIAQEPDAKIDMITGAPNPVAEGKLNIEYVVQQDGHVKLST